LLNDYLSQFPDSITAVNLRACNDFKLYNGKAAEAQLKGLLEKLQSGGGNKFAEELLKHNLVVFRGGEGALQILPGLLDIISEARLNLVIYHLKNEETIPAYQLMKEVDPATPQVIYSVT